jgi:ABC-type transport system involved in multi-copper enzyme maturation permease subunit
MTNLFLLAQNINFGETIDWRGTDAQWYTVMGLSVLFFILLFAVNWFFQFGVIARATCKDAIRQPVFMMLTGAGILVMLVNTWVPFFSLGDDTKLYIDCGLATILICSILFAVWTASMSVADEIEGKTAMTLLSKPITRQQFVLGKYVGILQAIFWMITILTVTFSVLTFYKIGYDAWESGQQDFANEAFETTKIKLFGNYSVALDLPATDHAWVVQRTLPSILLTFMEVAIMAGISVAISTRLPMVVNLVGCLSIFVIGHLLPIIVDSTQGVKELEFVPFLAKLFAVIFPVLEVFNTSAPVATGMIVPPVYIGGAAIYCICYCIVLMLVSFLLFEDRDLA